MDDLFKAISMFNDSMSQLATTSAVNEARDQVQQINSSIVKEGEKRQALTGLANDLALRLSASGAPATTIQAAFGAVAPESFKSAEEAQWANTLNTSDTLQGAVSQGQAAEMKRAKQKGQMELGFDLEKMREQYKLQKDLLTAKAEAAPKKGLKSLNDTGVRALSDSDNAKLEAINIMEQIKNRSTTFGPAASRLPARQLFDKDFAGFQSDVNRYFNTYRKEITGAGASNQELETLRESLITATDTPASMEEKLSRIIKLAERKKAQKLNLYKKAKYDVGDLEATLDQDLLNDFDVNTGRSVEAGRSAPSSSPSAAPAPKRDLNKYFK